MSTSMSRLGRAARLAVKPGPLLILGFLITAFAVHRFTDSIGGPDALLARFGWGAPALIVFIQGGLSAAFFPSELFTLATSAAYGWWIGALTTWLGWILGSMIQFGLARRSALDVSREASELDLAAKLERLPAWLRKIPLRHPVFLIVGRWIPAGAHVVNIGAGVSGVPVSRQLWTAAVGSAPGAVMWAGIGASVGLL